MTNLESFNDAIRALKTRREQEQFSNYFIGIISCFASEKDWEHSITKALQLVERLQAEIKPAVRP